MDPPDLRIVSLPGARPPPPKGLTAAEQRLWRAIVNAVPGCLTSASSASVRSIVGIASRLCLRQHPTLTRRG
jgi:hypothetical protein